MGGKYAFAVPVAWLLGATWVIAHSQDIVRDLTLATFCRQDRRKRSKFRMGSKAHAGSDRRFLPLVTGVSPHKVNMVSEVR